MLLTRESSQPYEHTIHGKSRMLFQSVLRAERPCVSSSIIHLVVAHRLVVTPLSFAPCISSLARFLSAVYIFDSDLLPGIVEDPHMRGLQGQSLTWSGEEGGWYAMLSGSDNAQLSVRITAPLPAEFPDRQLVTGLAIKYGDGNSIVIETKNPYTTEVEGCPGDWSAPCLSENALRITVGGEEQQAVPDEAVRLAGNAIMLATNLPPECQPFGGDIVWAETFAKMTSRRLSRHVESFTKWASMWIASTAAPTWCTKFIEEAGMEGVLASRSKHSVFRIQTPTLTVRLHHGTNHQGGEVLPDGRVLPKLEFWQMNVHLEWYNLDEDTVTGMLGETIRPVLDEDGLPIMAGDDAMRGEVEDYRISGPLATDFKFFHE